MPLRDRPYAGDDLRRMQALQQELWALEGPRVQTHVGDLAWWLSRPPAEQHLWLDGERCVGWARFEPPATLDYAVHTEHRSGALHHDVLDWFEAEAQGDVLATYVLETDDEWIAFLTAAGYRRPEHYRSYAYFLRELDADDGSPGLPTGFTLHTVADEDDFRRRVDVHRAVWAPSRLTDELYRRVTRAWPYRSDLDCVVEAPDGTFAAYVLCWYDDENRVGELEPVGTRPEYRRRGLGALACRYALRRLQQAGARTAVVVAGGREEDAGARALYESVGFRQHTRAVELRKRRA